MKLPEYLKHHRELNHLTQEQVAEKLFVTRQAVSKWERGEAMPEIENILRLSDIYNVSIDELLRGGRFLQKPFTIGDIHVKRSGILFIILAVIFSSLASTNVPKWIWFVPFTILVTTALVTFRPEKIIVDKTRIVVYTYKNFWARIKSVFTSSETRFIIPYENLASFHVKYVARRRLSPMDLGPDLFECAFKDNEGNVYRFEPDHRVSKSLPVMCDFLGLKGVPIRDKYGVVDMIAKNQNVYETVRKQAN